MLTRRALTSLRRAPLARGLSSRASTVLSALDIRTETELPGVYDGEWTGSGEVFESVCPTTGEVLARVKSVCPILLSAEDAFRSPLPPPRPHPQRCSARWSERGRLIRS